MRSFNQVTLIGNLTRDPDLQSTKTGQSVCNFSLALNSSYTNAAGNKVESTDFIDVVAWGALGDNVSQYVNKGNPVLVTGRLQSRVWEKDGQNHTKVVVIAEGVTFLAPKPTTSVEEAVAVTQTARKVKKAKVAAKVA